MLSQEHRNTAAPDILGPDTTLPSLVTVQKLNQQATATLSEIVRKGSSGDKTGYGYDRAEVAAARELLDRDKQFMER